MPGTLPTEFVPGTPFAAHHERLTESPLAEQSAGHLHADRPTLPKLIFDD
jgi:hypothetical protein